MKVRIGQAASLSRPESFKYTPDDRQSIIETDGGNIVQDFGNVESGGKITFTAVFHRDEFLKLWEYYQKRILVDFTDPAGNLWQSMRVRVISYGYEERFRDYIDCELELWRI